MASRIQKKKASQVIGAKAFAAITAVEGLKLAPDSRRRIKQLMGSSLGGEERRAEVLRAYRTAPRKK